MADGDTEEPTPESDSGGGDPDGERDEAAGAPEEDAGSDTPGSDENDPQSGQEAPVRRPEDDTPVEELVRQALPRGYVVDPRHQPLLTDRAGSVRTDDVGRHDYSIASLAPVFRVANRRSLLTGARAIDERDPGVDDAHITFGHGAPPTEDVERRIDERLDDERENLTQTDKMSVPTDRRNSTQPDV